MHFQNLQDRHKLCIFNITLFAYDFLFEQHRNSHDECLMNRSTSNQGARHDHCPSSGAVKSRFKESLKMPNSQGQISAWVTWAIGHEFQQRILHDQTSSGSMATQHYRQWHLLTSWERGHSWKKNTTHNQRPARSTGLGKNKGFPANQKGSGKNKGWKWKNLYTRQVENLKRRLGQKRVSRWTENPKGRSRQNLGIKVYDYVPSSRHLPTRRRFVNWQVPR